MNKRSIYGIHTSNGIFYVQYNQGFSLIKRVSDSDLDTVNYYLHQHGEPLMTLEDMPAVGFSYGEMPLLPDAYMFLRQIEGGAAMIDSLVTNPKASSEDRHKAIEILLKTILNFAGYHGITKILVLTRNTGILKRSLDAGFSLQSDFHLLTKRL